MPIDPREHAWFISYARARIAASAAARGLVIAPPELWAYEECVAAWLRKPEHRELHLAFVDGDQTVIDLAMDYVARIFPHAGPPQYTPDMGKYAVPSTPVATPLPVRKIVVD